jgi:response regulator of citrate/malate metabolism
MSQQNLEVKKTNRVLVVEDDLSLQPFWSFVLHRCFEKLSMEWAISGEQAKKIVQKANVEGDPFRLVISDIFLAGAETGLDLMGSREFIQSHADFILVSVADEGKVKDNFMDISNLVPVMTKPLNAPECEKVISVLIEKRAS